MSRILVRNTTDNRWLDFCKHTIRVRSPDNRSWISVDPRKLSFRDGANSEFILNDCSYNELFDDICHNKLLNSVNCPPNLPADFVGSGNGQGSGGAEFNLADGYPAGYDLPDAGDSGFVLERDIGSPKGWSLKRPALNFAMETYDESGITPSYGRGSYANPNYLGSSVFGNGSQITETVFDVGSGAGYFELLFSSFDDTGISLDVYYLGNRIATTCGFIKDRSKLEFYLDPAVGLGESRVMVRVRSREASRWAYQFVGPKLNLSVFDLDPTDINEFRSLYTSEYVGSPIFPALCHSTIFPIEARYADGKWFYEFFHTIADVSDDIMWDLVLDYTSWLNADKFEVFHGGIRIASTMDGVSDLGMLKFRWNPKKFSKNVPDIMIRVTSNDRIQFDDMKSWYYTLFCPNVAGYRTRPWRCGTPIQGVSSMGHNSTEDNYDLDNGVDPGVVSIKLIGHDENDYTVTVFDSEMNLIDTRSGKGMVFVQFFIRQSLHGDTRKKIAVRVDGPLLGSWTYFVGCPIPVLDVEIDDKIIPVCEGEVELAVNDIGVIKGSLAKFTVTSSIPSIAPITINYSTQDGSATATGISYTGLPAVFGIQNETNTAATYAVHKLDTGLVVFDSSWYRLANNDKRVGLNSNFNNNILTSTFINLSPDAKILINAWKKQTTNLNGKRWLIITSAANNWAELCINVVESIKSIYGIVATVVTSGYENIVFENYDFVTVANTEEYCRAATAGSTDYITSVYNDKYYSVMASKIVSNALYGKILHCVLFSGVTSSASQYANGLAKELLNYGSRIDISFDPSRMQTRPTPQYYAANHLINYPDTPLLEGISIDDIIDGDNRQVMLEYKKPVASLPADYKATVGSVVIPIGATSTELNIETFAHTTDNKNKTFFVNLTSSSAGDISKPKGRATFITGSGQGTTDFNFSKSTFLGSSYNNFGNELNGYGAAVVLGIGYVQVADGKGQLSVTQKGKVAYAEVAYGNAGDIRVRTKNGLCAEYPYDPALSYTFKWELFEVYNDINNGGIVAKALIAATDFSATNDIMKIIIQGGHKTDKVNTLRSSWQVFAYIKSSDGKIYRSQELSVTLSGNASSYA